MGRNAYINFYVWFYNENRGQAPVTTIAKRAGITWRKMTPQEKDRFMDRNFYLKGKIPLSITKTKVQKVNVTKAPHKRTTKSKRSTKLGKRLKSISPRNARKKQMKTMRPELKQETCNNNQPVREGKINNDYEEHKRKAEKEEKERESESEETLVRRKGIRQWIDKNHYA